MFCFTMRMHFLEILIAFAICRGLSSISTTSAASIAASEPIAPIAIPMSARVNTGASFMPSPTKARFSFSDFMERSFSTSDTLSPGSNSLCTSSTPRSAATCLATLSASPVSMIVFLTPAFFSSAIASLE